MQKPEVPMHPNTIQYVVKDGNARAEGSFRRTAAENSECNLTKHSKIALLKMFMLKKQLNLLR